MGIMVALVLFVGMAVIMFFLAKSQQALVTREPVYSASEYYQKGVEQIQKSDYPEAEKYLEKALAKEDSAEYRSQLALVKYRLRKYEESVAAYKVLISKNEDPAFAWNGIGNAYRDWAAEQKDGSEKVRLQDKAKQAYREAIAKNGQYVAAYSNLSILLASTGASDEARQVIDEGIAKTGRDELRHVKANLGL